MGKKKVFITPDAPDTNWQENAACAASDPELFFLPDSVRGETKRSMVAAAKAVCIGCPVINECLAFALADDDARIYGIYGGTTPEERAVLLNRGLRITTAKEGI